MHPPTQHFLLGFASALSAVWVSHQILQLATTRRQKRTRENTDRDKEDPSTTCASTSNQDKEDTAPQGSGATSTDIIMDRPDLDQRMIRKAEAVLQGRTSRITVVVERCTNDHNYSAILRTAEALGVQHVWIIDPPPPPTLTHDDQGEITVHPFKTNAGRPVPSHALSYSPEELRNRARHHLFAQHAHEWLTVRDFATTSECIQALRETHHTIWVTDLSQQAVCLTQEGLQEASTTQQPQQQSPYQLPHPKLAIVFGTEAVGCSKEFLQHADRRVYLPLRGFADSLNLSVATALVLQQLFLLDPTVVGDMADTERRQLRQAWYTKLCQQRLLTPKQKRTRHRLQTNLLQCDTIVAKQKAGKFLQPEELHKLAQRNDFQRELQQLEQAGALDEPGLRNLQRAIQDLIDHPPQPLSDLRRADNHRVCYVGKNTKEKHKEHWKDMAATANANTQAQEGHSASFFRQRVFGGWN